jgi:hypothetical protein
MWEGTTSRMMVADRPYGEFYDFYSISPEYSGYHYIHYPKHIEFVPNQTNKIFLEVRYQESNKAYHVTVRR